MIGLEKRPDTKQLKDAYPDRFLDRGECKDGTL